MYFSKRNAFYRFFSNMKNVSSSNTRRLVHAPFGPVHHLFSIHSFCFNSLWKLLCKMLFFHVVYCNSGLKKRAYSQEFIISKCITHILKTRKLFILVNNITWKLSFSIFAWTFIISILDHYANELSLSNTTINIIIGKHVLTARYPFFLSVIRTVLLLHWRCTGTHVTRTIILSARTILPIILIVTRSVSDPNIITGLLTVFLKPTLTTPFYHTTLLSLLKHI